MAVTASARLILHNTDTGIPGAFGLGCVQLLEGVARERSLNRAAKELGMAYSKAWRLMREAEAQLGMQLLVRDGARGSSLTPEGQRAVAAYRTMEAEMTELLERRCSELFS